MPQLQDNLGYSALTAGAALLPVNAIMLALSPVAGRAAARIGPRLPMAIGALVAGAAMLLFSRVGPGASYLSVVLPAAVVFGLGVGTLVAPLTAAVLGAVDEHEAGVASGINNAAARLAGLISAAALPLAAGIGGTARLNGPEFSAGYVRAMWICAGLCAAGSVIALLTIQGSKPAARGAKPAK
jgi:MFS family permease